MNTYVKYAPNVYVAKCTEQYEKGAVITMETRYGRQHEAIVFKFLLHGKDGFFYHSVVRADGFNYQEFCKRRAERLMQWAGSAVSKSDSYYKKSQRDFDFLKLGEPIKVGHHSEGRHRKAIEQSHENFGKHIAALDKAEDHKAKAGYWARRMTDVNLSMPESLEYFQAKLEKAIELHKGIKDGSIPRTHSYNLQYANKEVKELKKKVELAKKLWQIDDQN